MFHFNVIKHSINVSGTMFVHNLLAEDRWLHFEGIVRRSKHPETFGEFTSWRIQQITNAIPERANTNTVSKTHI